MGLTAAAARNAAAQPRLAVSEHTHQLTHYRIIKGMVTSTNTLPHYWMKWVT
jgi:hypothetical protein